MSDKWITIPGEPVAKPRQTRSDKWKQRPCVMRYRAWADVARFHVNYVGPAAVGIDVRFYLPMPVSWSTRKKVKHAGTLHRQKPDIDNCIKSIMDALLPKSDAAIARVSAVKFWDDGRGARTEVRFI